MLSCSHCSSNLEKAKRRSAQMHGSGVADLCEEDNPRLHISRRLYARRAAPVHSQSTANHHHQKPSRHPSSNTYVATRRTTPHLQQNLDLLVEASVCRMGGTELLHLTPHHADRPRFSHELSWSATIQLKPLLQALRLRRVFHLLCVQHLHKSKLNICGRGLHLLQCSTVGKRARILRASV